jgi:hypothetical protein
MMKKMAAAALAALALAGTTAVSAQAATPTWTTKDYAFVRLVRSEAPAFKAVGARLLVKSAHLTCDALDEGLDESEAAAMMMDSGFTQHQALVFTTASMVVYCPWHGDDIRARGE